MEKEFVVLVETFFNEIRGTTKEIGMIGIADTFDGVKGLLRNQQGNRGRSRDFYLWLIKGTDQDVEDRKKEGEFIWDFRGQVNT